MRQDNDLQATYPPGYKFLPVVIPFSSYGNPLSEDEIAMGAHTQILTIDSNGIVVNGFTRTNSRIFKLLPREIQDLAFDIGESEYDVNAVVGKFENAYQKLKKLLS